MKKNILYVSKDARWGREHAIKNIMKLRGLKHKNIGDDRE